MSFGILTLATNSDYLKAIGLALSLRVSNPGVQIAVACQPSVRTMLLPYFDYVVDQDLTFKGFEQKVNLDRYSPFDETLFFDSDILVFRPVRPFLEKWGAGEYVACGSYVTEGFSVFGMDRARLKSTLNKDKIVKVEGAGHGFFRKPACLKFFDKAREVTKNYKAYVGDIKYADEDAISITMTMMDLPPTPHLDFFSRHLSAKKGTLEMDATKGLCKFMAVNTSLYFEPCMMHFAANEAPIFYTRQLWKLFKHFGVPTRGLLKLGLRCFYKHEIKDKLHKIKVRYSRLIFG